MTTKAIKTQTLEFRHRRRAFMLLPLVIIPFLFLAFISLGGGKGQPVKDQAVAGGFNKQLPAAKFDKAAPTEGKMDYYKRADQDSIRRREYLRQDPNYQRQGDSLRTTALSQAEDRTDLLMEKLRQLKKTIHEPPPTHPTLSLSSLPSSHRPALFKMPEEPQPAEPDPDLVKLDGMLDKMIRIQNPNEKNTASTPESPDLSDTAAATSIPAVVQEDQVLVAGGTIALRLTEEVRINNITFPRDQLAYGVVSISNDRMLVTVTSLRRDQSIYTTALQVYDLDGLPGIHIPGDLGRETAKQTTEQSINSLGYTGLDASPLAQVTNAGVQTARSLLSRKVRMVRVGVRAGYHVLLRSARAPVKVRHLANLTPPDSLQLLTEPADFTPFMHVRTRRDKMELTLESIYLKDDLLWFTLRLANHSLIGYSPDYIHWSIRDKHRQRRTAMQDLSLKPVYDTPTQTLAGDSARAIQVAFQPFALPRDKELVLQVAEANGARALTMRIGSDQLLKARSYGKQ